MAIKVIAIERNVAFENGQTKYAYVLQADLYNRAASGSSETYLQQLQSPSGSSETYLQQLQSPSGSSETYLQ